MFEWIVGIHAFHIEFSQNSTNCHWKLYVTNGLHIQQGWVCIRGRGEVWASPQTCLSQVETPEWIQRRTFKVAPDYLLFASWTWTRWGAQGAGAVGAGGGPRGGAGSRPLLQGLTTCRGPYMFARQPQQPFKRRSQAPHRLHPDSGLTEGLTELQPIRSPLIRAASLSSPCLDLFKLVDWILRIK